MAENTSVLAPSRIREEDLQRAEEFALEPFVHEGEDADVVLAEGTPRRRALDDALAEIESGRTGPSIEWQRKYSLMLGLERLLAEEEPHLADGTVLSAHQVDALSGTLIALLAEAQSSLLRAANGNGRNGQANGRYEELPTGEPELEGDEEIDEDEEPVDWEETEREEEEEAD